MTPIRILVNGAKGRMGQLAVKTLAAHPDFVLVGQAERSNDLSLLIQQTKTQVVVDFTSPKTVFQHIDIMINQSVHPVIGTTGLTHEQIQHVQARCKKLKLGGIIAPNFSLGMALLIKSARDIARYFPQAEIIEMHHEGKLDSPSGTALYTAEQLAAVRKKMTLTSSFETIPHARGAHYHDIPLHSVRLPGLVAHETILFGGIGETLTLKHDAIDRQCFMPGVILACQKVIHLKELVYGLEGIL